MNGVTRRLVALVSMVAGTTMVFGMLYYMNELLESPPPEEKKVAKEFTVAPQKKQQRKRVKKKPKKTRKVASAPRSAPMPNITSSLSGLSFDIPSLQTNAVMGTDDLLKSAAADKKLVMTEDSVDSLPTPRSRKAPDYPAKARQRGIQGHVLLKLKVSERGQVEQIRVVEAEPVGVFETVAVAAVREWQFEPARYQGEPVAVQVSQRIPFRLN